MNNELKIVFAGTPLISKVILENILTKYKVDLVLTQPDRPKGRGKKIQPSPVKELALEQNIEILQPQSLKNNNIDLEKIRALNPDIMIVVAYGILLPVELLKIPRLGCVNIHMSLLPKLRGAAPIQRSIINGDDKTGVTIMQMDKGLDTGDILLQEEMLINDTDTSEILHNKLARLGSKLIAEYLYNYPSIKPIKQSTSGISYAHKIDKNEACINWNDNAKSIWYKIRGFNPSPGCYTYLDGQLIKIWQASIETKQHTKQPGTILEFSNDAICVACGNGTTLEITILQKSGKNRQTSKQFYIGHPNLIGAIFLSNI
ncbi:MAG: methionyl-tRNA formyltransferase [Neisseriaceae bacterium]